jgi:glucose/arabinose dehydrogenase
VSGRPVDLLVLADGSMLVSDDRAGMIYRISYGAAANQGLN